MAPPTCEGLKNVREETELLIKHHCPCKMPNKIEYACTLWPSLDCEGTLGHMHQEAHPKLSPTALFIVTKHWTWSICPVAVDWTSQLYILTLEYLQGGLESACFLSTLLGVASRWGLKSAWWRHYMMEMSQRYRSGLSSSEEPVITHLPAHRWPYCSTWGAAVTRITTDEPLHCVEKEKEVIEESTQCYSTSSEFLNWQK